MSKKELTPELRKLLAQASPIDEEAELSFTLAELKVDEIPEDIRPVYKFKSFLNKDKEAATILYDTCISSKFFDDNKYKAAIIEKVYKLNKQYITGWENIEIDFHQDKIRNIPWETLYFIFCRNCYLSGIVGTDMEESIGNNKKIIEDAKKKHIKEKFEKMDALEDEDSVESDFEKSNEAIKEGLKS